MTTPETPSELPDPKDLTDDARDGLLIAVLLTGVSKTVAAVQCGYSRATVYRRCKDTAFVARLRDAEREITDAVSAKRRTALDLGLDALIRMIKRIDDMEHKDAVAVLRLAVNITTPASGDSQPFDDAPDAEVLAEVLMQMDAAADRLGIPSDLQTNGDQP